MSQDSSRVHKIIDNIEDKQSIEEFQNIVRPRSTEELETLPSSAYDKDATVSGAQNRLNFLKSKNIATDKLNQTKLDLGAEQLQGNIENFIGFAQIPVGLAGPLLVNGTNAYGDFYIPLATSEGALVASYNRGMKACRLSGGISSVLITEGVQRSPFFKFDNIVIVGLFAKFILKHQKTFEEIVAKTSNHAKLQDVRTNVEGNSVILTFDYSCGDAAGQNMVTICTDQICKFILTNFKYQPLEWYIESNYAGDKKATATSFAGVRGKKVVAEVILKKDIVESVLKTTPELMAKYWQSSTLAVVQSGAIGAQGHIANGLTALFIACGQDVACVSESAVGITRMEVNDNGDLYASLTMPSLIVGTVGGGTGLPTQHECLEMLGCTGKGTAKKFAEICCAVSLAGELSIASAMSVDHFTHAHQNLGRKKS